MSRTKHLRKVIRTLPDVALAGLRGELEASLAAERNALRRCSMRERLAIVGAEEQKRTVVVG